MNALLFCLHYIGRLETSLLMWHVGPYLLVGRDLNKNDVNIRIG